MRRGRDWAPLFDWGAGASTARRMGRAEASVGLGGGAGVVALDHEVGVMAAEEGAPQERANAIAAEDDDGGQNGPEPERDPAVPVERKGMAAVAREIDEGAIGEAAPAMGVVGIAAEGVGDGRELAQAEGLLVGGEDEDVALAILAHLGDEFSPGGGAGEVEDGVGPATVAVAAGDGGEAEFFGETQRVAVLGPGAEAVEFEGVNPLAALGEESANGSDVLRGPDTGDIPARMVEDDEGFGRGGEPGEQVADGAGVGGGAFGCRAVSQGFHGGDGVFRREMVDTDVEVVAGKGNGPLDGDGGRGGGGLLAKGKACGDAVMVRNGDEGSEAEVFDLGGLRREDAGGGDGRGPVGAAEIDCIAAALLVAAQFGVDEGADDGDAAGLGGQEFEALPGMQGVAVERGCGAKEPQGIRCFGEAQNARSG